MKNLCLSLFLLLSIMGCSGEKSGEQSNPSVDNFSQKQLQYYSNGRALYKTICSNCHMENGEGLGRLIPPLAKSDYLGQHRGDLTKIIKYGLHGPITVNQVEFNQPMPGNPNLTDLEVLEILTYIGNSWGNELGTFSMDEVK